MLRKILKFPEPVLRKEAAPVVNMTGDVATLVDDMVETMYAAPGIGLAAPQVGMPQRVVVLDIDHENPGKNLIKLVNPVIKKVEGEVVYEEGCLSVLDFTAEVKRAAEVQVVGYDLQEHEVVIDADGLLAVALQHELDHLNGKLFIDRISRLKRDLYVRRLKKAIRNEKELPENPRVMI